MPSVTIDSNLWEQIVHWHVFKFDPGRQGTLRAVNAAIGRGVIKADSAESVATVEGVPGKERGTFLTNQPVEPRVRVFQGETIVVAGPNQSSRPPIPPVLNDRLKDAIELGIRLIGLPVHSELELPEDFYADEPPAFIDRYARAQEALIRRGVGKAPFLQFASELARRGPLSHVCAGHVTPSSSHR